MCEGRRSVFRGATGRRDGVHDGRRADMWRVDHMVLTLPLPPFVQLLFL